MLLQYALLLCTCMTHRSDKTFCVSIKDLNLIELLTLVYMCVYVHKHAYTYTCLLLLILMLWHRQAIFESKGDKLSSSAECRIRTQGLRHLFTSGLNACWQTDWAIEDQAKNLNSTACPYDQQALSPLDLTANWLSHLALAIYMFVVVNFDALAQASDIRIERRQVVFLCWMQDSNTTLINPVHFWCFYLTVIIPKPTRDTI